MPLLAVTPFPGAHGFMKLDPDGTHPVTWNREEDSRNRFPGSHCPELGRIACVVCQQRAAGTLDHPSASPYSRLT